tara:strand:- start:599 stop:1006 length:408 start_codon:yes stop_codon:yes gene_type:complete
MENAINKTLYKKVVKDAKTKFDVWPSAYASMWVQREYQKLGGTYSKKDTGLKDWRQSKWIQVLPLLQDGKIIECGADNKETKACRPIIRSADTSITIQELLELYSVEDIIKLAKKKNADMDGRVDWKNLKFTPSK